jgi:hypothetical protein
MRRRRPLDKVRHAARSLDGSRAPVAPRESRDPDAGCMRERLINPTLETVRSRTEGWLDVERVPRGSMTQSKSGISKDDNLTYNERRSNVAQQGVPRGGAVL